MLWGTASAVGACVAPPTVLTQRFMAADCAACWSTAEAPAGAVLDWLDPPANRAPGLPADRVLERQSTLMPARLRVVDGFAFNGYIGLQLEVERGPHATQATPAMTGWMALVERIRAGRDGSPVDRQVVRQLVGPLSLRELATTRHVRHLAAVRVPAEAQAERLASVAWLEDADGRVVSFVESAPPGCRR